MPDPVESGPPAPTPGAGNSGQRASSFWAERPAPPADPDGAGPILRGIPLAEEVIVLLHPSRPMDFEDIRAIQAVAAPLLAVLGRRGLIRPRRE